MKPLTLEETRLKEQMKERCLAKGQYIDENAKAKFDMLCHLEDFEVQYWELQQENQKYKEVIFKIKMIISARIKEYQKKIDNEIDMGSQGDHFKICRYEEKIKFLKDILKEVE